MRSFFPLAATARATAAFVTAFLMQVAPAAAQRICGDTPVEVSVQVYEKSHGEKVARALWSNCARRNYGDQWGSLGLARAKRGPVCYNASAWRSYYNNSGIIACAASDIRYPTWVCFYRATPCRHRYQRQDD
jgi:hypothetical protein